MNKTNGEKGQTKMDRDSKQKFSPILDTKNWTKVEKLYSISTENKENG